MSSTASKTTFGLKAPFVPKGDQPEAIKQLVEGIKQGQRHQTLLGITGSGKTFTMANVIKQTGRPGLIIAPNKTLAAQLYGELKELFPENAVHYFVSYYDYYQPEAYVATSDTYIEKDATINDEIDRMRHAATYALLSRKDVIIVASVSCIYGIGAREIYSQMTCPVAVGDEIDRDTMLRRFVELQYDRNDIDFHRGTFRVRGDTVEVFPAYEADTAIRIEFWGDEVESISEVDPLRGVVKRQPTEVTLFPASHYVTPKEQLKKAIESIRVELRSRLSELSSEGKLVERQRLEQRTMYDLEMLEQIGFCNGIENYSRHLTGRKPGEPAPTLIDYFPKGSLTFIDESHQTIAQLQAMYRGDRSRKQNLVEFGFRLPSALDNRPLRFEEWKEKTKQVIYVSATPTEYEIEKSEGVVVEQIIRPTGLLDPQIQMRPVGTQVDDLLGEIRTRVEKKERVLVTTLTKRMAEDLTEYYTDLGIKVRYLHSDIETLERVQIILELRRGEFDVLVGINLLREGLDIPEVSLVAILDADKEGFLRSTRSLIQTMGRAARNANGTVILYADKKTKSITEAVRITEERREIQKKYNQKHGITPTTTRRELVDMSDPMGSSASKKKRGKRDQPKIEIKSPKDLRASVKRLRKEMREAADAMEFERAAELRDQARELEKLELTMM